jgi:hypothetical protein
VAAFGNALAFFNGMEVLTFYKRAFMDAAGYIRVWIEKAFPTFDAHAHYSHA